MVLGKVELYHKRMKLDSKLILYGIINTEHIKDLIQNPIIMKLLEEKKLDEKGLVDGFLGMTPKAQSMKEMQRNKITN